MHFKFGMWNFWKIKLQSPASSDVVRFVPSSLAMTRCSLPGAFYVFFIVHCASHFANFLDPMLLWRLVIVLFGILCHIPVSFISLEAITFAGQTRLAFLSIFANRENTPNDTTYHIEQTYQTNNSYIILY